MQDLPAVCAKAQARGNQRPRSAPSLGDSAGSARSNGRQGSAQVEMTWRFE